MTDFENTRLDDAEIVSIQLKGETLYVTYKDWREQDVRLAFNGVIGYQWFSPERRALSHGTVERDDPFLSLACEMADENGTEGFSVFSFVSVWNDAKILRIVAEGWELR
jgi:hypothetical protein